MAHILAEDIGVKLEFVPFEFDGLDRMLDSGQIDMAMSCIAGLPDRYSMASFSRAYLDLTLAFIVRDHERHLYDDLEELRLKKNLTTGAQIKTAIDWERSETWNSTSSVNPVVECSKKSVKSR